MDYTIYSSQMVLTTEQSGSLRETDEECGDEGQHRLPVDFILLEERLHETQHLFGFKHQ